MAGRGAARRDPAATSSPDKHARSADSGLRPWGSSRGSQRKSSKGLREFVRSEASHWDSVL